MSFLLQGLACSLAVFYYVQNEISTSQWQRTIKSILSSLSYVNDLAYLIDSDDGFVYAFTKKSDYPTLFDPYFNLSTKALVIFRAVEYCQLLNKNVTTNHINYRSAPKYGWFNKLINNSLEKKIQSLKMTHHTLSSKLFEGKYPTKIYYPSPEELYHFHQSEIGKNFNYVGHGWFYKFGNKRLNKNIHNEHYFKQLFTKCSIGDIRMQFSVYSPPNVSVIGWKKDSKLKIRRDINGRKYGVIREGKYSAKELLDYSNGIDSSEIGIKKIKRILKNKDLGFGFIIREIFPYKAFAFLAVFTMIILFSSSPINFLINLLFILDINIYFRSIVCPNSCSSFDLFWGFLSVIQILTLLYVFLHEQTSEIAYISFYSMAFFIILFQSKDIFHSDDFPFISMNNKKNKFINSTNSS